MHPPRILQSLSPRRLATVAALCGILPARLHAQTADFTPAYTFTTRAGTPPGYLDATGSAARFDAPGVASIAVDSSGNVYAADTYNPVIRKITPAGVVSTLAGVGDATIAAAASRIGAFSWGSAATADLAILITLPPGACTAQVSGACGDTGVSLVEVCDVQ